MLLLNSGLGLQVVTWCSMGVLALSQSSEVLQKHQLKMITEEGRGITGSAGWDHAEVPGWFSQCWVCSSGSAPEGPEGQEFPFPM